MSDENNDRIFTIEKLIGYTIVNQIALISLAVESGKTEGLKNDLDKVLNHFNQNGLSIGGGRTLTKEENPVLFQEIDDAIFAIKYAMDQWEEPPT